MAITESSASTFVRIALVQWQFSAVLRQTTAITEDDLNQHSYVSEHTEKIFKRLNEYLVFVQEQGEAFPDDFSLWPNHTEAEDLLTELASVLGKLSTQTEKTYNQNRADQLEQAKKRLPVRKLQLEIEREEKKQALKRAFDKETQEIEDKLAAVKQKQTETHKKWLEMHEALSASEKEILRIGDEKTESVAPLNWGTTQKRVEVYRYKKIRPHKQTTGMRGELERENKLTIAFRTWLFDLDQFPWQEYIRLSELRDAVYDSTYFLRDDRFYCESALEDRKESGYEKKKYKEIRQIQEEYEEELSQIDKSIQQLERSLYDYTSITEIDPQFKTEFYLMVKALKDKPIATDKPDVDCEDILIKLKQGQALVNIDDAVYEMETVDLNTRYLKKEYINEVYENRIGQIREQTRQKYCRPRIQVESEIYSLLTREEEEQPEEEEERQEEENLPTIREKEQQHDDTDHNTDDDDWKLYWGE